MKVPIPELRNVRTRSCEAYRARLVSSESGGVERIRMVSDPVPGVELRMPIDDWQQIQQLLHEHHTAQSTNPAVRDAWNQYRMLLKLTRQP